MHPVGPPSPGTIGSTKTSAGASIELTSPKASRGASTDDSTDDSKGLSTDMSTGASLDTSMGSGLASTSTDTSLGARTLTDSFPHAAAAMTHPPAASQLLRCARVTIVLVFTRSETQG
jgi:hypothetical protein